MELGNHIVTKVNFLLTYIFQIFTSGGYDSSIHEKRSRQSGYQLIYHFTCSCVACRENWPSSGEVIVPSPSLTEYKVIHFENLILKNQN